MAARIGGFAQAALNRQCRHLDRVPGQVRAGVAEKRVV